MHRVTTTRTYIIISHNGKSASVPRDDLSSIAPLVTLYYFIIFSTRHDAARSSLLFQGRLPSSASIFAQLYYIIIFIVASSLSSPQSFVTIIMSYNILYTRHHYRHYIILFGNWRDICRGAHRCDSKPSPFSNCPSRRPRTCPVRGASTVYRFGRGEYHTSLNRPTVQFSVLLYVIFYPFGRSASSSPSKIIITPFFLHKILHTRTICVYY